MLSFYIFAVLMLAAVVISLIDRKGVVFEHSAVHGDLVKPTKRVWWLWGSLAAVMVVLYIVFNGH